MGAGVDKERGRRERESARLAASLAWLAVSSHLVCRQVVAARKTGPARRAGLWWPARATRCNEHRSFANLDAMVLCVAGKRPSELSVVGSLALPLANQDHHEKRASKLYVGQLLSSVKYDSRS